MRHLTRQNNGVAHPLLHVNILDTEECKGTNILFSDTTGKFVNKSVYTLLHLTLKNTPRSLDVLTDLVAAYYRRSIIGCTLSLCRAKRVNDLTMIWEAFSISSSSCTLAFRKKHKAQHTEEIIRVQHNDQKQNTSGYLDDLLDTTWPWPKAVEHTTT